MLNRRYSVEIPLPGCKLRKEIFMKNDNRMLDKCYVL